MTTPTTAAQEQPNRNWDLYVLLSGTLHNYHTRWIDNFRVILTFNAFFAPAVVALLALGRGSVDKVTPDPTLLAFVAGLSFLGACVTTVGFCLVWRIHVDTMGAIHDLRLVEDALPVLPARPLKRSAIQFGFDTPGKEDPPLEHLYRPKWKGVRAKNAYLLISVSIVLTYLCVAGVALAGVPAK